MSSRRWMWLAAVPAAVMAIMATVLPADFTFSDPSSFARDRFGVRVGMSETEARAALRGNYRFRYAGRRDCTVAKDGELYGCADATEIEQYRVNGLLRDGEVAIGVRDGKVIYIFSDQVKARKI